MDLTVYEKKPEGMLLYLMYNGEHFSKLLCAYACKQMKSTSYTKDDIMKIASEYKITLPDIMLYDDVYLANRCKKIYYDSAIPNDKLLLLFIKDTLEKEGNLIFNRWYADMSKLGIPINWENML